ncbi:hypothetical protein F5146DRAFT_1144565 [Armillaria mellea]|nr:hypothetical protein F5146DRAFT_1144565 [Armillaria mellea]
MSTMSSPAEATIEFVVYLSLRAPRLFIHLGVSLCLLPFVVCTTAGSPVSLGHRSTSQLQHALDAMDSTFHNLQGDLSGFATNVDVQHAMAIKVGITTLSTEIKDAEAYIPDHLDVQWVCDTVNKAFSVVSEFLDDLVARKDDLQTVGLTTDMCHALQTLVSNSAGFDKKFIAAVPPSATTCTDKYYSVMEGKVQQALVTFC